MQDIFTAKRSQSSAYWDGVARSWLLEHPDRLWRQYTDKLQIALLERWLGPEHPKGQSSALKTDLFDEVASQGIVHHLQRRGYVTSGIDISPLVIDEAARRNPELCVSVADVRKLPFQDDAFDLIFSGSTLDHFDSPSDISLAIRELGRVLRPSGKLILTLDNPINPVVRLRNSGMIHWLRRRHIVPYQVGATLPVGSLVKLVEANGFEVEDCTAILHAPRVLAVVLARLIEQQPAWMQKQFIHKIAAWERLEAWPSRFISGYFTAILAVSTKA